jgi:heat shock protein HspQ
MRTVIYPVAELSPFFVIVLDVDPSFTEENEIKAIMSVVFAG